MILFLFGCTRKTQVGICFRDTNAGVTTQLMHRLTGALKDQGYQVTAVGAANDQVTQNNHISRFLDNRYDLLIIEPVITAEAQAIAQRAAQANVPVIFLNYEPDTSVLNSWDKLCYIGCDLSQPGEVQSRMVEALSDGGDANGDGSVGYLVISGPENHIDAKLWQDTCCSIPQAQCLRIEHGDWTRESGEQLTSRCLWQHEDQLDVIFCMNEEMSLGALEAIQAAEKTVGQDIYLVSIGGAWQVLASVAEADITGTVCPDISALTQTVTTTTIRLLSGRSVEKRMLLDYVSVTAENVTSFMQG